MMAFVPAAGAWLYVVGQSAGTIFSALDDARALAPPATLAAPAAAAPTLGTSVRAFSGTRAPALTAAPSVSLATASAYAGEPDLPPPAVYASRDDTDGTPLPHPEIGDERMRALLQPAWDD
jgi:hypothetical protein